MKMTNSFEDPSKTYLLSRHYLFCLFYLKSNFQSLQSLSSVRLFATPLTAAQQASLSITNSRSSPRLMSFESRCHPTISSSVVPFSSCLQSFPASGSFIMSQLFTSGGQSIGVSASTSVLLMNTQDWYPLDELVGSPCSPRDSQESSPYHSSKASKLQCSQLSLWFNSCIHTWPLEKP